MRLENLAHADERPPHPIFGDHIAERAASEQRPVVRLLIIDDEVQQDNAMVTLLTLGGVEVTCALSGGTGLELAVSAAFDAILLDLKLPDILGMTVLSELRRLRISVPVLVVTGYFLETDHDRRALQLGAAAFLRKPLLNVEELPTIIRDTVARHVPQPSAPARLPSFGSAPHFTRRQPLPSSICRERVRLPELTQLHQRAVQGDADARDSIASLLLPELRRALRRKWPHAMPDWIDDSVIDAVMEYRDRPDRYDGTRGLSLLAFLEYASSRNLLNYRAAHRRRALHETTGMPPGFWDAVTACRSPELESPNRARLRNMLATVTADFTQEERKVFELQMQGEHRASVYGQALHVAHLDVEERVCRIRRVTNRVSKRVRRGLERLRAMHSDTFNGRAVQLRPFARNKKS